MNRASLESWRRIDLYGEKGSAQRKAHELKLALGCIALAKCESISLHERKAIRRAYHFALMRIQEAFEQSDAEFFYSVADGLKRLREKEDTAIGTPLHCLFWTYFFFSSRKDAPVPTKAEIVALTKRQWAICRLSGEMAPAFITYDYLPEFEAEIAREIRRLPKQNWTRHFKMLGLTLPHAKPGPKKLARIPRQ